MIGLRLAVAFLTVFPTGLPAEHRGSLAPALPHFPLVGLALGAVLLGLDAGLGYIFPPLLAGAVLVTALLALTRGLHLEGFLDACDGLLGGYTRERRLEILRDSHIGAFAAMGGTVLLLLKWTAVVGLPLSVRAPALVLFPALGRWGMVFAMARYPYARREGLGTAFTADRRRRHVALALAVALLAGLVMAGIAGAVLVVLATLISWALGHWMHGLLGGLTGDTYGAVNELTEVAVLLASVMVGTLWPALIGWPLHWGGVTA